MTFILNGLELSFYHPNVTGSKFHCRDIPDDITRFQRIYLLIIISHLH